MSRWKKESVQQNAPGAANSTYSVCKTETFFTRHARLLTFLTCIAVFLLLFWPIAMPEMRTLSHEGDRRPQMTQNDVLNVAKLGSRFTESQASKYLGNKMVTDYENYYYIDVEPHFQMLAVYDKDTKVLLFCQLFNEKTGEKIDVLKGNVAAFMQQKQE